MSRSLDLLNQLHLQIVQEYLEMKQYAPTLAEEFWQGMHPCLEVAMETSPLPDDSYIKRLTLEIEALLASKPRVASPSPDESISTRKRGGAR
jgi:hypothetical protein